MSASSRAQSQSSRYSRKRSDTVQSVYKPNSSAAPPPLTAPPPVKVGESKTLASWVHDPEKSAAVIFNHNWWPGINEGDLIRGTLSNSESGFLFYVPKEDQNLVKPQLQISIPRNIAEVFRIRNYGEITVTKLDRDSCKADYVEFAFQDQYLGRNEMWRLAQHLVGKCVYVDQDISFIGVIAAKVTAIYVEGHRVTAGCVTPATKAIYRSLSAKTTVFIQICKEFWQFADDGERHSEKVVHSFLPALCTKWREAGTNHIVTIVLVSRVFYDQSEIDYAAGPLRRDDEGRWYKDFYRVITGLEVIHDWKSTLVSLKDSFWAFQRDILLTHHYHQASLGHSSTSPQAPPLPRLVGQISYAHDGPILEALNMSLNPTETHYIDRSLSLTGASMIIITPGTGYFRVSKHLLRLTTTRLVDQGLAVDLITLTKPPLHQSPIFCFWGVEPELKAGGGATGSLRSMDPLWGGDDDPQESLGKERSLFWWEPFWMSVSFWDKQMDLPFREDRFVARARMYEIRALGLLDHDVLSSIEIPYLPKFYSETMTPVKEHFEGSISKEDADKFDQDVFALSRNVRPPTVTRNSYTSSGSGTIVSSSYRSAAGRHIQRSGSVTIPPIEESPRLVQVELQPEGGERLSALSAPPLSSSPSRSSVHSKMSVQSGSSGSTSASGKSRKTGSRFAPAWLFNPFRGGISQPQTSNVSASAVTSPTLASTPILTPTSSVLTFNNSGLKTPIPRSPKPVNILPRASPRSSALSRTLEEESNLMQHRGSLTRTPPLNTPPRTEAPITILRRTGSMQRDSSVPFPSSLPNRTNPSFPREYVPYPQSSLARRWQHGFPQPLSRMEIKWRSMVAPACLPLTVEHFPTKSELETSYDIFPYEFVVDPPEMGSFLVKPPSTPKGATRDEVRRAWAAAIMREMVGLRLAQGFQFILKSSTPSTSRGGPPPARYSRRSSMFIPDEEISPQAVGAADVLTNPDEPVYLSMSNEIHKISYTGETIRVRRYVRRVTASVRIEYQCLIWPKFGEGYTELRTSFTSHGLENYGWNRLDMLIAGYENQLHDSLKYWRTRFIVIPSADPPLTNTGPTGEKLDDEEIRLVGMDKLAELFSRVRWQPPEFCLGTGAQTQPIVRFLLTDLGPAPSLLDEALMNRLDEINALGPLRKNPRSEKEISQMTLGAIGKAMREDPVSLTIKDYRWHGKVYADAFTGSDFVNWLVREFRDVASREQAVEIGRKLKEQGLFDHARKTHGFLDGYYFYQLRPDYSTPSTPRGWFRTKHPSTFGMVEGSGFYPGNNRPNSRRTRKRLILSQSLVIDIDGNKRSDQAETAILHHDIIHNPTTSFHFELQWIGTTARCIEDQLKQWSRTIERYGLKLVEAYVGQICDIREQNPFQSCYPVRLSVPPPIVQDLDKRVPEGTLTRNYFESALLRKRGFVLDIEAGGTYPEQIDPVYSYRRAPFKYSQWVHRTGVVFAQVLGGTSGFLFLTNRLIAPGRMGTSLKSKELKPSALADEIMFKFGDFCSDPEALNAFFKEEMGNLAPIPEDPPPFQL